MTINRNFVKFSLIIHGKMGPLNWTNNINDTTNDLEDKKYITRPGFYIQVLLIMKRMVNKYDQKWWSFCKLLTS